MVEAQDSIIKIKTAIVLTGMLNEAKKKGSSHSRIANNPDHIINSIGKISLESGLRKNTISDLLNGKKATKLTTLLLVLTALDKTLVDFSRHFEKISDSDIQKFKELNSPRSDSSKIGKRKIIK